MKSHAELLAIVPAFNEAAVIRSIVEEIREHGGDADVLVVDDGSSDDTSVEAQRAGAIVVRHPFNMGVGAAVQTGYKLARQLGYGYAAQVDGDGQHPAVHLPELLAHLRESGADMVIGSRFVARNGYQSTKVRRLGIRFISWLLRLLTGQRFTDPTSGFRVVNERALALFAHHYPEDAPEPEAILLCHMHGMGVREFPVSMRPRSHGQSSIYRFGIVYYMLKITIALTTTWLGARAADEPPC